jgi:hypothetical protein
MGIERPGIAAEGTIKAEMHKTPTTECVQQLFDARRLRTGSALLILHGIAGWGGGKGWIRVALTEC